MYYIISIILGLIPEVLFFTLFFIYTKNIKNKRLLLFLSIAVIYFLCVILKNYVLIYYVGFIALVYFSMKLLYRKQTQIIDVFVISIPFIWITLISYLCFLCLNNNLTNYYLLYILDRIIMFLPFIFKREFNKLYKSYCRLWNRNDKEKRPIKSITLRNTSLIIINLAICFMNIYAISIIKFLERGD